MDDSDPSTELSDLLHQLPHAQSVGIADPEATGAELGQLAAGQVVLGVGVPAAAVPGLLGAARRGGVAAVVLRAPVDPAAVQLAGELGVELHQLPAAVGWHQLHQQLLHRLQPAVVHADDELADLAQTIATLTGGPVTIEDSTSARVLAYSRSSDEVDELRRLSILGRSGPPEYLALLREWGVYRHLARSEDVLEIAEHPASGVRRRLAVGVFAGDRQLATIWVQQGAAEFGPHARQALLGAARLTALHLVSSANRHSETGRRDPAGELAAILTGQGATGEPGRLANQPWVVAAIVPGPAERDAAATRRHLDELTTMVTVHAVAYRRHARTGHLDGRVYLLLPRPAATGPVLEMITDLIGTVRRHLDPGARATIGTVEHSLAGAVRSRRAADLALSVETVQPVLAFEAARPSLITTLVENCLTQQPELIDARVTELVRTDPAVARTLLRYLDTGSDVARVAAACGVHPTTVRYRLRRALASLELDLDDPDARLAVHVQLRRGLRTVSKER